MKQLVTLVLCLACVHMMNAQSLSLLSIDASNFPSMKGKFYAFDATGKQQSLTKSDLTLTENTQSRIITSVTCPVPSPPKILSTVLVIDISGSMKRTSGASKNIDIAKTAAYTWVRSLPLDASECAVTSFDSDNYLNQDFTTDVNQLNTAIGLLTPQRGTDYDAALLTPMAGGLEISKNGRYKKVIIMLTDGQGGGSQGAIISEANRQGCTIYCVTIGMPAPAILQNIAANTGGMVFDNVRTEQEVEAVYKRILDLVQGDGPCEITWDSKIQCAFQPTKVNLLWNDKNVNANGSYTPPANSISSIKISPQNIALKDVDFMSQTDTTITLTALNDNMLVLNVVPVVSSAAFTLLDVDFPRMISQNTSSTLTLRFNAKDSNFHYVSYLVLTPECSYSFSATGSIFIEQKPTDSVYVPKKKNPSPTLVLTHPNGGETFVIGSDTIITWKGIAASDTVALDYSIDNGTVWKNIIPKTTGLEYRWNPIPAPSSTKCLVRVSQLQEIDSIEINPSLVVRNPLNVTGVAFSPDGNFAASSGDSTAKIWDTDSGKIVRTFIGHTGAVNAVAFSQDSTSLITCSADSTAILWNIPSGVPALTMRHNGSIYDVACSNGSNIIATASEDSTAKVWDMKTGQLIHDLKGHTSYVYGIAISNDGNRIATSSYDKSIIIWDAFTGNPLKTLTGHKGFVYAVAFSPDGTKVGSVSNDNTARIWDVFTGATLKTLNHNGLVSDIAFSPNGKQVITASKDYYTRIWDVATGTVVRVLGGSSSYIKSVAYSANGKRIITGNNSREAAIWDEQGPLQEDISDKTFSIVAPQPAATDVAMGTCSVGKTKDSLVTPFIWNARSYPFRVKSVAIVGQDAAQFTLISGIPPVELAPSDTHAVEFRFRPSSPGVKTAQLIIYTQSDTLKRRITGEGVAPAISILGKVIDFGKVLVNTIKDSLQTVTVRNTSKQPITITATRHAGPNMVDYSTLSGGGNFTLQPGDTAKLDLRFYPKNPGRTSGRILFDYDGIDSPETVQLFGEGVKPGAQILAAGLTIPPVICSPETTDTLRIFNRGTDTLRVKSATITGSNSLDFQFDSPFTPFALLPDSMVILPIKFTPATSGMKTALLELRSNSILDSILKLPLSGQKDIVAFSTNNQKIDLGTLCPNESRDTAITLTNTGSIKTTFLVQSQIIRADLIDSTLNPADNTPISLRFLGRSTEGIIDEVVTIIDTLCGTKTTVQVIGNIQLPRLTYPPFVDFGAVANGAVASLDIIAVNKDSRSLTIAQPTGITAPFTIISLTPPVGSVLASGDTLRVRVQYSAIGSVPKSQMIQWSTITPCATLDSTELRVSGITHTLASVATVTFDSVCLGQSRQLKAMLTNTGSTPLQLLRAEWITNTGSLFSATVSPTKILAPGTSDSLDITFTPSASGLVNADIRWVADVDTAFTTVSGIGKICATNLDTARTTIIAPDITAKAGEKVNLTLRMVKPTGMEITGAPTEWQARIHYNKSILFNEQTNNVCPGTTDSCALELSGVYNPKSEELISIPCITTLGNTDHSTIVIDTFFWKNSAIVTEVATQNGSITLNGVCEDGGVRLFIPATTSTSLSTRPNPAQDKLQIQYGLREPLTVTLELLTMTGQVVQTILTNQSQVAGQYTLTNDLSVLGNGVYLLRMRTNKEMLTTRVDVVK